MKDCKKEQRNIGESMLTRLSPIPKALLEGKKIVDIEGKEVKLEDISRKNELAGEAAEYLTCLVDYILNDDELKGIVADGSKAYYEIADVNFDAAIDVMTSGIKALREDCKKAVAYYMKNPPTPRVIVSPSGSLYYMQPFVITIKGGKVEKEGKLKRLANLKTNRPEGITEIKSNMTLSFSKPLFSAFFEKEGGYYYIPNALYAHIHNYLIEIKKHALTSEKATPKEKDRYKDIDAGWLSVIITRFARYVLIHNNFTTEQLKQKDFESKINIEIIPMLQAICPQYLRSYKGKTETHIEVHDAQKVENILKSAISTLTCIEKYCTPRFLIAFEGMDSNYIHLTAYHPKSERAKRERTQSLQAR